MFAQVIQGRSQNSDALRSRMEEWDRSLKQEAEGFLGSTAGVSDSGDFIALARFESEEAAQRNSERPEQSAWWAETEELLEGDARFYDSTEVEIVWGGGSDEAGFVQVIQGRLPNEDLKERWRRAEAEAEEWLKANRPDLMGGVRVWQGTNFSDFIYFTSEQEAREGEKKAPPPGSEGSPEEWMEQVEDIKFIDLRTPFFSSPQ
jgi:hypothetical protein